MKFLALVCCVASVAATVDWNADFPKGKTSLLKILEGRIVNGQVAKRNQFPYQAGLLLQQGEYLDWCGGTLISNKWVLTAAHCTQSITRIYVGLGSFDVSDLGELGRQIIEVDRTNVIVHEDYDHDNFRNDISLIRLPDPVEFNDYIQPAKLPTKSYSTYSGAYAITSGWGRTNNSAPVPADKLRWISVPILDNAICRAAYPTANGSLVQIFHICISTVGIKSVCNGDSGGPLVLAGSNNTVIGITSFGSKSGCENEYPNVFTRVSYYLDWISERTGIPVTNNAVSSTLLKNGSQITTTLFVIIFFYKHLILIHL